MEMEESELPALTPGTELETTTPPPLLVRSQRSGQRLLTEISYTEDTTEIIGKDGKLRDETENPRAAQAFKDYLSLGMNRSIEQLATYYVTSNHQDWIDAGLPRIRTLLRTYAANYDWETRVRIFTVSQTGAVIGRANRIASERREARMTLAKRMQTAASYILEKSALFDADGSDEFFQALSPELARELLPVAIKLASVGMDAERVEVGETLERLTPTKPVSQMSNDELDAYIEVLKTEGTA